jgi:HEPN domain-containing protein
MPAPERVFAIAGDWVRKAENDLMNAAHTLKLGARGPTDTICFHSQQCVEKYLKALLVLRAIDFPKTHDVEKLISLLPAAARVGLGAEEQARLTEYATGARYPGWSEIPLAEARRAVAIARRVRREIRRMLPREIVRRKAR